MHNQHVISFLAAFLLAGCYTIRADRSATGDAGQQARRVNTLIIQTKNSPDEAYRRLGQILIERDYALLASDNTMLSITTDWKAATRSRMRVIGLVTQGEVWTEITLKGQLLLNVNVGRAIFGQAAAEDTPSPIEQYGPPGSPMGDAFKELEAIARTYPEAHVLFVHK